MSFQRCLPHSRDSDGCHQIVWSTGSTLSVLLSAAITTMRVPFGNALPSLLREGLRIRLPRAVSSTKPRPPASIARETCPSLPTRSSGGGPSHQRPHHQGHEARWQPGPFRTEQQHQNTTKAEPGQPEGPERCAEEKGEVTPFAVKPTLVVEGEADQDSAGQKTDEIGDEHGDKCSVGL